ncbi:lipoyl(octanoyl) transferase LipB [Nakamurella antarctica]|uniref:Octanoyltransferase n=1 Tax=Nakamurella antarctica TaxID=1902245 RepID=A0A3G8ZX62_9ACTN|nr:lipoyl(octanoyl) transferase LipB [Nakamurella antarctica]AZI58251.1 lipoyl(octanoyl) transferase LipB [Nakamurella antarctica]
MRESAAPITYLMPGLVDYQVAWDQQRQISEARLREEVGDTILLLEHPPVYTAGRRTEKSDLPVGGTPVVEVDRGGRITWHGPGQLVAYPIIKLAQKMFVVNYVRMLERALIAACRDLNLEPITVAGRTGVWFAAADDRPERKVAAIGVRVAKGVTSHGIAINCNADLAAFDRIVPCGIADAAVTSLSSELGRDVCVAEVQPILALRLDEALNGKLPAPSPQLQHEEGNETS